MSWIQTYTGKQFFPLNPRKQDIDIRDIARSLSYLCRFNGHCTSFYSVADHCLRVSAILPDNFALWGLLHDAAEAYISDVPRPVKAFVPEFTELEEKILAVIAEVFSLPWPMPAEIRQADDRLLATEARDLVVRHPASWDLIAQPLEGKIIPLSASKAEEQFLVRFQNIIDETQK